MLWGAGLACALGGAVAGTAVGSTPILDRPTLGVYYQSHQAAEHAQDATLRPLPDHYPLVTREGIVPVAQLSERGLFSQARYRAMYGATDYAPLAMSEAAYEPATDDAVASAPVDAGLRVGDPVEPGPRTDVPPPPLELAAGPASVPANSGRAKTINVETVLALR